jgi:hypothetical protein
MFFFPVYQSGPVEVIRGLCLLSFVEASRCHPSTLPVVIRRRFPLSFVDNPRCHSWTTPVVIRGQPPLSFADLIGESPML